MADTREVNGVKNTSVSTQLKQKYINIEIRKEVINGIIMKRDIQTCMKEVMIMHGRSDEQIRRTDHANRGK